MSYIITAKNSIITFSSLLIATPKLFSGFSSENIMVIEDTDIVKSMIGLDGTVARSVMAKMMRGSFSFYAGSPTLSFIYETQQASYISGIPLTGTLNVVIPGLATVFTYPDFCFESAPKGFELGEEVKPVSIKWSSAMPNYASLGTIATAAISTLL